MELIEIIRSIFVQIWGVVIERPIVTGVVMFVVFGCAVLATYLDEANRKVDALINEALDTDEEAGK